MKKGFSLIELMVGLVVSLILIGMMAVFMGDVSYVFQDQKANVRARGQLQRNLLLMSREIMEAGYSTQEKEDKPAQIEMEDSSGNKVYPWFLEVTEDDNGFPVMSYWTSTDSMDTLSSADDMVQIQWTQVVYQMGVVNHPVTGEAVRTLLKNGIPYIFSTSEFSVELGLDLDGDGLIAEDEWSEQYPEDETEKALTYTALKMLRVSITTDTKQASKKNDNDVVQNRMSQEIFLRNRSSI